MINPTPPYGWRIVDKAKDDPSDFDRIMLWSGGRWEPVANTHFSPIDWMHYAVPIDPGPDHRLIDPETDKPEDHPDAEVWLREGYGWTLRLQGDKCQHWCRNSVYRTPIKKAEPMKVEIEVEIPQHILDRYDVVAFRKGLKGEYFFSGENAMCIPCVTVCPQLILRPKAQWTEWPEWLTADWAVRDSGGSWFFGTGEEPKIGKRDWNCIRTKAMVSIQVLCRFTNIPPPTYDGPWQHSLIRNPWKGGE